MIQPRTVVIRWFTSPFMILRSLVKITSGIKAKAIPNESTTWLMTSALVALMPKAMMASGGIIVIARRR
ncbi:hypothetical protein D3C81_1936780 [compost metagenome]